ncbi:hypothetical protein Tco_0676021 [Tanacetum coccineum]
MIGSLLYLTASRPDIMFSVYLCARLQEDPKTSHLEAVKRIFRYIKVATHLGLWYPEGTGIEAVVYVDSDHAGDYVDRKSTSGIFTFVGCCLTSWFSKKQTALAISTTEAEYVSIRKTCQQALWMKQALIDYDIQLDDVLIMCDNKGDHRDHVPACLCHMLYCIETSTKYNLAFFILKRMESIQNLPKANLTYGMLLTRLFTHIVSNFPELSDDRYILCDRVMHPLAPHYEQKTRSDHGTKRCHQSNPSSSSNVLDHSSSSHHVDENVDENDEESSHSNTPSPS